MSGTAEPSEPTLEDRAAQQSRNGWGPLPLPTGKKAMPPKGFTGAGSPMPSYADWYTIYEEQSARWGNLGTRIPENVVGVDVDAYGDKNGAATFALLGGVDYPPTVVLSARFRAGYDGKSGIRFYRLPDGVDQSMLWGAHDGIEILRFGHRYAVSPGSLHPDGFTYQLFDQRTQQFVDGLPPVEDLPMLTVEQARTLTVEGAPWAGDASDAERPKDEHAQCPYTARLLNRAISDMRNEDSRYGTMSDTVWALVNGEDEGHHLGEALELLKLAYVAFAAKDRREAGHEPPASEFDRNVKDAYRKVGANPTDEMFKACCADYEPLSPPGDNAVDDDDFFGDDEVEEEKPETAYEKEVRRQYVELRIRADAKALMDADVLAAAKPLVGLTLEEFLAEPDEDAQYRVTDLWPSHGRVLLPAPAKGGKSTLLGCNLLPSLVDGTPFLGRYDVQQVTGNVIYFNMEIGEQTFRRWLRDAGVQNTQKVIVVNLRGKASALQLTTEKGRKKVAEWMKRHEAEATILDPLAPLLSALGIEENDNSGIARFFSMWSETLDLAGIVDDIIAHHTGHAGERSRGASRLLDEPDAIWTLTKDQPKESSNKDEDFWEDPSPTRYLQAYGRDVDLAPEELSFDPETRLLTLTGNKKGAVQQTKRRDQRAMNVAQQVREMLADGKSMNKTEIARALENIGNAHRYAAVENLIISGVLYDTGARRNNGTLYAWSDNPKPGE